MNNLQTIERIRTRLAMRNPSIQNSIATQGYLRLMVTVNTGAALSGIQFNVLSNQGTINATEQRLPITDMFTITHWGLYLFRCLQTTTAAPTAAQVAAGKLYTNPNSGIFSGAGESALLMNVYNGSLQVTVDRERLIDGYDAYRFYRVGVAQDTVALSVGGAYNADEWQGPNYGMAEVDPEITLNGVGQNDINVNFANPSNLTAASGNCNFLCLVARGIRWQNASKLNQSS